MSNLRIFVAASAVSLAVAIAAGFVWAPAWWSLAVVVPLVALGIRDVTQRRHAVLRNFPVIGHFRYLLEAIRPEIQQYFIESDIDGRPFSREIRAVIYQRA